MYSHRLELDGNFAVMKHIRETQTESGLVIPSLLGVTAARFASRDSGIVVLPRLISSLLNPMNLEQPISPNAEDISCQDLDDFIAKARNRWHSLGKVMGNVVDTRLHFTEINTVETEEERPSGLVVPLEVPEVTFERYVARPDEISAMELIQSSCLSLVQHDNTAPQSQLYL